MYCKHILILDSKETQFLDQLLQFLDNYFIFTKKSFVSLVKHFKIIYELLWTLFQLNVLFYITYLSSEQSRCLIFDSDKEKWIFLKEKQFELQCHYFDYNNKSFNKVTTFLYISHFYEVKRITSLNIFSLQYHKSKTEITWNLIEWDCRFITLMRSHHCNYKDLMYI